MVAGAEPEPEPEPEPVFAATEIELRNMAARVMLTRQANARKKKAAVAGPDGPFPILPDDVAEDIKHRWNRLICPGHDRESLSWRKQVGDVFGKLKPMPLNRGAWVMFIDPDVVVPALDKLETKAQKKNLRRKDLKKILGRCFDDGVMFLPEDKMLDMAKDFGDGNQLRLDVEHALAVYDSKTEMVIYYELKTSEDDDCRRWVECVSTKTFSTGDPFSIGPHVKSSLGPGGLECKRVKVRTLESEIRDALPPDFAEALREHTEKGREQEKMIISLRQAIGPEQFDTQPQFEPMRRKLATFAEMNRMAELGMAGVFAETGAATSAGLLSRMANKNKCVSCGNEKSEGMKFYACARCKSTHYCSNACQKVHWKSHKEECALKGLMCAEIAKNV